MKSQITDPFERLSDRDWVSVREDGSITHIAVVPKPTPEPKLEYGDFVNDWKVAFVIAALYAGFILLLLG